MAERRSNDDLLATMRARFQRASDAESRSRAEELDDLRFSHGDQWPADVAARRRQRRRPCLVINQLPQYIRQVTNEQRQNRPSIRVVPVDDYADPDTAKVLQGLIRHIEVDSSADVAYDTAFEASVRSGKGYFRVLTEYVDAKSFDQCIKIKRIRNRFTVYLDPAAQEPDGSDAEWGMIVERRSRDLFAAEYPEAEASPMAGWTSDGDGWIDTDEVRVCEYFYRERVTRPLVLLSDGTVHEARMLPDDLGGREIVARRDALTFEVQWIKSNGYRILEEATFPGHYIPIIPVLGDEADLDGEVLVSGLVRHAKDAQRMYNYWCSSETEAIALAPRAPWIAAEGQLEGYEQQWANANEDNVPFLYYKPRTIGTELAPPPQRQVLEPAVQAITQARLLSRDDLKATTGIYDASLGARSNESSGRAIIARQREGDVANYHYPDNLARALRHCGRILVQLIPQIYSSRRVVRILGEDNTAKRVQLNGTFEDEEGIQRLYQPGLGRYDVVVDVGPSYSTKRQETVATMLELTRAYPALFQVSGDLLVKNMDWPGAQDIAERLQSLLPPELRPTPGQDAKAQLAQLRAAVPQLQQQLEALNAYAQEQEARTQQLTQENAQLKSAAQAKAAELAVKQEENAAKAAGEQARLVLEDQKLRLEAEKQELEEQKFALDVAKARAELGIDVAIPDTNDLDIEARTGSGWQDISDALTTLRGQLDTMTAQMTDAATARRAPKRVEVTRQPDGTLVGAVMAEGEAPRMVAIRPAENGFEGEMS